MQRYLRFTSPFSVQSAVLLLLLILLAGCAPVNPGAESGSDAAADGEGPVQIEFWTSWAPEGIQGQVLQTLLDEYNEANPDVVVEHIFMGQQRNEKIAAALASGEPPDIAWLANAGEEYYESDLLISMDRVYNGEVLDRADLIPTLVQNQQYLGEDISIPFENSNLAVYYNKGMLDEAGVDYPPAEVNSWTWSDFIALAQQFSDPEAGEYAWDASFNLALIMVMHWSAGGDLFSEDLRTNLVCSDPDQQAIMHDVLTRMQSMVLEDRITTPDLGDQGFGTGDMLFEITGPWALPRYADTNPDMEIGIAAMPADEETGQAISYWYQKALALFKTDAAREAATLDFISWFYSPDIHARWSAEAAYLPITLSATEHPIWQEAVEADPRLEVFMEQAETMQRRPFGLPPGSVATMADTVILNEGTPQEAIDAYCQDAQLLVDEFWARRDR